MNTKRQQDTSMLTILYERLSQDGDMTNVYKAKNQVKQQKSVALLSTQTNKKS